MTKGVRIICQVGVIVAIWFMASLIGAVLNLFFGGF